MTFCKVRDGKVVQQERGRLDQVGLNDTGRMATFTQPDGAVLTIYLDHDEWARLRDYFESLD